MRFLVTPDIFARFPQIRLAVIVAEGLENQNTPPDIAIHWQATWKEAVQAAAYGNAQSHPRIRPWREHFQALGVSSKAFPSSIEALLRRVLKGGEPFFINALVDFYNTVSLRHVVPVGGFDLDQLRDLLELRLTCEGDTFRALGEQTNVQVPAGEVAYANGQTILTRHFVWRQAQTGLITPSTQSVFLVSEILDEVGQDVAEAVLVDLQTGIQTWFNRPAHAWLLDERNAAVSW